MAGEGASENGSGLGWEEARAWLASLPRRRNVTVEEVDAWLDTNAERLTRDVANIPRRFVHEYMQKQHKLIRRAEEGQSPKVLDPPLPRFKQSDKWKPVWDWLDTLDTEAPFGAKEITEWLALHPRIAEELEANHSRHNLFKYVQKCYYIVSKKKRKQGEVAWTETTADQPRPAMTRRRAEAEFVESVTGPSEPSGILTFPSDHDDENQLWTMDKEVVKRRYELLCQLQLRLQDLISEYNEQLKSARAGTDRRARTSAAKLPRGRSRHKLGTGSRRRGGGATSDSDQSNGAAVNHKRKLESLVNSWAFSLAGAEDSEDEKAASTLEYMLDREAGLSWSSASLGFKGLGGRPKKWSSVLQGWHSLEKQFTGPGVRLQRNFYSSLVPAWSAYSSNAMVQAGRLDLGVQKVLDVRFNPSGIPQLVCGCNAAPNELLLYDLTSGKATPLVGHNCQVQAVEYASEGSLVVSCANNIIKVWDSSNADCVRTLGPGAADGTTSGHKKKISAMAVNPVQSCLVATSGGQGDCQLLLWNVSTGSLVADLNASLRQEPAVPSMDALEFCKERLLMCGSDSAFGGPSVVQLWDIDALKEVATFPANATFITCLKANPAGTILVTGSGDGTIGLFDIRSCGGFSRLPVGPNCEVTSVSFSSCGRYIQASSTGNSALVWDTRIMPMEFGPKPDVYPPALANPNSRSTKPLHNLSHGKPMPTAENTSQRSGFVDVGDQGVNDARWFGNEPLLVTASGNGSIALWDVTLGQPCLRHIESHSRCINTVAVSPNDEYICSGGDDQKLVLYENVMRTPASRRWRLTHPLSERTVLYD